MLHRILSALLALMLLCAPALADDAPDASAYPALPLTVDEYTTLYTGAMTGFVDPHYSEYAVWHLVQQEDGSVVLTDGIGFDGVYIVKLHIEGAYVKSIVVSYPYDGTNAQENYEMFRSWGVIAATPVYMRDGLSFYDALSAADKDFVALASRTNVWDVIPVCGMEAQWSRTTGENGAVHITYTFHQEPAAIGQPTGDDLTAVSAGGYMRALDDFAGGMLDQRLIWTDPEEWLGCTLYAVDSLGDTPALMVRDDLISTLMVSIPMYPGDPQESFTAMQAFAYLSMMPVLTASGMTGEEAEAAFDRWETESHWRTLLASALSGTDCRTEFFGFDLRLSADREANRFTLHLITDRYWEIELPAEEASE